MTFEVAMRGHNVVFIVGAGVSLGATQRNSVAGWRGLVEHGIRTVISLSGDPKVRDWERVCRGLLDLDETDTLLSAASRFRED